jgi:hypothetical protein
MVCRLLFSVCAALAVTAAASLVVFAGGEPEGDNAPSRPQGEWFPSTDKAAVPEVVTPSAGVESSVPNLVEETAPPEAPLAEQPPFPQRPLETPPAPEQPVEAVDAPPFYAAPVDPPLGHTGPSGILPRDTQESNHFVPVEDRWRIGFPEWDRYGKGHPPVDDYPYALGSKWDPYNQNVLKGDYPILGQHTFFVVTATSKSLFEERAVPTATTPFESTANAFSEEFFGKPNQFAYNQFFFLSLELFHGDTVAFRPMDWRLKVTPVFNFNYLTVEEQAVVNPDVTRGVTRGRTFLALQEWFVESKLSDLSPYYDFFSVRAGAQPFVSDFRGFIFADINRGVRLFGNRNANREQFNLAYFDQLEKDTNSELNTLRDRQQQVLIGNYFIQDFIWPGYTFQLSLHYNHDDPTFKFDKNDVLVRPDPAGVFRPHRLDVAYLGFAGDGHINRFNVNHAFYWALGHDSQNPIANCPQDINAQMAAVEVSYDRDYIRFRTSFFWASGDDDITDRDAEGFDAIFDNPNFAGGEFSYWQRQAIRLLGVNLVNRESLLPNLRSSKIQGQSNFVNPGLLLANFGVDVEITPRLRLINNLNLLWFDSVNPLQQFVYQGRLERFIGTDLSMGVEYRPLLSNNVILTMGISSLLPGAGFRTLYNDSRDKTDPLLAGFVDLVLTF